MKNIITIFFIVLILFNFKANSKEFFFYCPEYNNQISDDDFQFHIEDNYLFDKSFYKFSPSDKWTEASKTKISKREFFISYPKLYEKYSTYVIIDRGTNIATFYANSRIKPTATTYEKHDSVTSRNCDLKE